MKVYTHFPAKKVELVNTYSNTVISIWVYIVALPTGIEPVFAT